MTENQLKATVLLSTIINFYQLLRMRICIISNLYEPYERGGAERVAKLMVEGLAASGHDVVVITTRPQSGVDVEQKGKVKIYRFRPLNLFYYLDLVKHGAMARIVWHIIDMFNWPSALRVRNILHKERPDLMVTHNLKGIGYLLPFVIRRMKIKHVHVLHDVQLAAPSGLIIKGKENDLLVGGLAARLYARACRALFGSPNVVVSPSSWLMKFYESKRFFSSSLKQIVPNPLPATPSSAAVKSQKQGRYLFVGQLEKHKGIEWLIDFWRENKITAELLVVGDGEIESELLKEREKEKEFNPNYKLLGRKERAELTKIIAQVDFLIVPSLCYENSPMVIPLAYQNATPVIVANIGGAGELVQEKETGFLFDAGEAESFRVALNATSALTDTEYEGLSRNCLRRSGEFLLEKYLAALSV